MSEEPETMIDVFREWRAATRKINRWAAFTDEELDVLDTVLIMAPGGLADPRERLLDEVDHERARRQRC